MTQNNSASERVDRRRFLRQCGAGLALKQAGATVVVGYANSYLGYFPIQRAYDEGGYEATQGAWSRVAPGSAERLQSLAAKLLHRA